MKKSFEKLISVKSIVTLTMTGTLVGLMFSNIQPPEELLAMYCTTYGAIITYFFTRKDDKNE